MRKYRVYMQTIASMSVEVEASSEREAVDIALSLSLIHISEPTRPY